MDATLSLSFLATDGITSLRVLRQDPPWRALRAFPNASGEALVHLHNISGGVLGGDQLRLEAVVGATAQAQITTVGATRVHRHRLDQPDAHQRTCFHVGEDALLEYLPDPVIPFASSRFSQTCKIHLAEEAGLIWWETIAAGRLAHGESFRFDHFASETTIQTPNGSVAWERYALAPKRQEMSSAVRMGPFLYSASMYVCRLDASSRWLALENELNKIAHELSGPETRWGVSCLVRDGVVVRGMTRHAHQASQGLQRMWRAAKETVWERPALLPRKIH